MEQCHGVIRQDEASARRKILIVVSGRGIGPALLAIAIYKNIKVFNSNIVVIFCSYGLGLRTLSEHLAIGLVKDMGIRESNRFLATMFQCDRLIAEQRPDLVCAIEEHAALPAAALRPTRSIFISDWLANDGTILGEALRYASRILILGESGVFAAPAGLQVAPEYVGLVAPVAPAFQALPADRETHRRALGCEGGEFCVVVEPGNSPSEFQAPFADLILSSFYMLPYARKRLFWIAEEDFNYIKRKLAGLDSVEVVKQCSLIDPLRAAASLIVSKGDRRVSYHANALGVPCLAISFLSRHPDDVLLPRIPGTTIIFGAAISSVLLAEHMVRTSNQQVPQAIDGPLKIQRIVEGVINCLSCGEHAGS